MLRKVSRAACWILLAQLVGTNERMSPFWLCDTVSEEQRACRSKVSGAQFQAFWMLRYAQQLCLAPTRPCSCVDWSWCIVWCEQPQTPLFRLSFPLPYSIHQIVSSSPSFCARPSPHIICDKVSPSSSQELAGQVGTRTCLLRFLVPFHVSFELLGEGTYNHLSIWYDMISQIFHIESIALGFTCSPHSEAVAGGAGGCWGHHRALQSGSTERCPGKELPCDFKKHKTTINIHPIIPPSIYHLPVCVIYIYMYMYMYK